MPAGRRRKTTPPRARVQRWVALGATVLAAAAVVVPVASALDGPARSARTPVAAAGPARVAQRATPRTGSRDFVRPEAVAARMAVAHRVSGTTSTPSAVRVAITLTARWVTAPLKVVAAPADGARRLGWVHRAYLSAAKPSTKPSFASAGGGSVSGAPCADGSSVESGLVTHTVEVYRAVCAAFPAVAAWGGRTGEGGDHGSGRALDIMCTGSLGDAVAAYVRAHASQLGVSYVIWSQRIWSVQRGSEGWRAMPDRGSATANHEDHVHVSVY